MSVDTITVTSDQALHIPQRNKLGESPIWVPQGGAEGSLLFVNVPAGEIHRFNLTTREDEVIKTGTNASFVAPEAGNPNLVIVGVNDGEIRRYEFGTARDELLAKQRNVIEVRASNDGKVAPNAEVWMGTKNKNHFGENDELGANVGTLGVLKRQNAPFMTPVIHDVHISQGPAWNAEGNTMYYNDSRYSIWSLPYNKNTGDADVTKRKEFVKLLRDGSVPDGLTVTADNRVIVAMWGHNGAEMGRVDIFENIEGEGRLVTRLKIPTVLQASSVIIGGPNYDKLFITTANYGKSETNPNRYSDAGDIFVVSGLVRGVPETPFNGKNFRAVKKDFPPA